MLFRSIRGKLTIIFLIFLIVIEGIQLLVCNFFVEDYYLESKKDVMEQAFSEMDDEDFTEIYEDIMDLVQDYEESNNLYFKIANGKGNVIYSSKNTEMEQEDLQICNITKHQKEFSADPEAKNVLGENSKKWMVLYGKVSAIDQDYSLVIWTCSEAEFDTIVSHINHLLIYAMLVAGLLGVIMAYVISKLFAKPIERIDDVTRSITEQDFQRIEGRLSKDEIGCLAANINSMSQQLEQDVTQLKDTNAKLRDALAEKGKLQQVRQEFLSNVSHELKTPLAIISGYVDMLVSEGEDIDRTYYSEVILDEVKRMNELIIYLLHVSNLEHITKEMPKKTLDASEIFEHFRQERNPLFEAEGIQSQWECEPECYILGNEEYIYQAMSNYIMNAMKYVKKNGLIKVCLKKTKEGMLRYSVYDEGPQIQIEETMKIWDSFYKIDKARTTEGSNVGLGLHIVKTVVEAHGGSYGVENKEDGVEFFFLLPLSQQSAKRLRKNGRTK